MPTPPDPDAAGWVVHLRPVADPLHPRDSGHARPGAYRLKLALKCLLRGFGLRCVAVTGPAGVPLPDPPAGEGG